MRRLPVLAITLSVASGCIPSRNNPHDPARAPVARLSVVSMEPCNVSEPAEGWPIASVVSRGACLALDARKTSDPQGGSMRFSYYMLDTSGSPVTITEDSAENFVPVPAGMLHARFGGETVHFTMTAVDSDGSENTVTATVVLTNRPPFVPEQSPILLPEGGFPWARGAEMMVPIDPGDVTDPDHDEIFYCWSRPTTPPYMCESQEKIWSVPISPAPGRYSFFLDVYDNQDYALAYRTFVVRVGALPLWAGGADLRRYDETLRLWPEPPGTRPFLGRAANGKEWLFLDDPAASTIDVYRWPELTATPLSINLGSLIADRVVAEPNTGTGGTRIWIAARSAPLAPINLIAWDLDAAGTSLTPVGSQTVGAMEIRVMAVDVDGRVGIGGVSNPPVLAFASAEATSSWSVSFAPGTTFEGGAVIPGTSVFSVSASGGIGDRVFVYGFNPDPFEIQELDIGPVRQLEYWDANHFWAVIPSSGLTLFERNSLTPLAVIPDVLEVNGELRVDRHTGTVHFATSSSLVTADIEARETRDPIVSGAPVVRFVDLDGAIALDDGSGVLRLSRTFDPNGRVSLIDFAPKQPLRTVTDGGVWAVTAAPAIVRIGEDGRRRDYVASLYTPDFGTQALVAPAGVVDPDGRAGWFTDTASGSQVLYRVDLATARGVPDIPPAVVVPNTTNLGYVPIGTSSPGITPAFAWLWKPGPDPHYATIDTAGNFHDWLTLTGETNTGAVVSHRDDSLCVFSQVGTTLNHRRITAQGVVTGPTALTVTSGAVNLRSPFTFPQPDTCGVVAGTTSSRVYVFSSSGALAATWDDADALASVTAVGDGILWASGSTAGNPQDRFLARLVQGSSGTFARETFPISVSATPAFFP